VCPLEECVVPQAIRLAAKGACCRACGLHGSRSPSSARGCGLACPGGLRLALPGGMRRPLRTARSLRRTCLRRWEQAELRQEVGHSGSSYRPSSKDAKAPMPAPMSVRAVRIRPPADPGAAHRARIIPGEISVAPGTHFPAKDVSMEADRVFRPVRGDLDTADLAARHACGLRLCGGHTTRSRPPCSGSLDERRVGISGVAATAARMCAAAADSIHAVSAGPATTLRRLEARGQPLARCCHP
jgi:hypothetical protein